MKSIKKIILNFLIPTVTVALIFLIWAIVAKAKNNPLVLPMPKEVAERFFLLYKERKFWNSIANTLLRTLLSFGISFIIAIFFATLSAFVPPVNNFLSPVVSLLRTAPTVAVILIFYAFFSNKVMSVIVGFLIAFPVMYSAFFTAVSGIDKELLSMAKVYKVSPIDRIVHIYLPGMAPTLLDTASSTFSLTFKVVIAAEILTMVPISLGEKIQSSYASFEISQLLAWTLLTILIGYLTEILFYILKKAIIRWKK